MQMVTDRDLLLNGMKAKVDKKAEITKKNLKTLNGVVVSDKMRKTAVVLVERYVKHPKYQKFITRAKRYKAHDEGGAIKVGDKVTIQSCRPMSRDKSFAIVEVNGIKVSTLRSGQAQ